MKLKHLFFGLVAVLGTASIDIIGDASVIGDGQFINGGWKMTNHVVNTQYNLTPIFYAVQNLWVGRRSFADGSKDIKALLAAGANLCHKANFSVDTQKNPWKTVVDMVISRVWGGHGSSTLNYICASSAYGGLYDLLTGCNKTECDKWRSQGGQICNTHQLIPNKIGPDLNYGLGCMFDTQICSDDASGGAMGKMVAGKCTITDGTACKGTIAGYNKLNGTIKSGICTITDGQTCQPSKSKFISRSILKTKSGKCV